MWRARAFSHATFLFRVDHGCVQRRLAGTSELICAEPLLILLSLCHFYSYVLLFLLECDARRTLRQQLPYGVTIRRLSNGLQPQVISHPGGRHNKQTILPPRSTNDIAVEAVPLKDNMKQQRNPH